jgi:hypothetical protein
MMGICIAVGFSTFTLACSSEHQLIHPFTHSLNYSFTHSPPRLFIHTPTRKRRSSFHGLSRTPSSPISVVPVHIASGCDSAFAINHGLKPRGYILPSLTGLYLNLKKGNAPILPLFHSLILSPPRLCRAANFGLQGRALVPD